MLRQASGAVAQRLLALQSGAATNQAGSRLLWSAALMESQAAVEASAAAQVSAAVPQAAVPQMSAAAAEKLANKRPAIKGLGSFKLGQAARPFGTFASGARATAPVAEEAAAAAVAPAATAASSGGWLRRMGAAAAALAAGLVLTAAPAAADEPEKWQVLFQDAATSQFQAQQDLHHDIFFFLITVVTLVAYMTFQIMTKFHYSKVAIPEMITHHTLLEVIWTVVPTLIVLTIAIPSLTLIYSLDQHQDRPGLTVKIIGRQWYWSYEVHDHLQQKLVDPDRLVSIAEKSILKA